MEPSPTWQPSQDPTPLPLGLPYKTSQAVSFPGFGARQMLAPPASSWPRVTPHNQSGSPLLLDMGFLQQEGLKSCSGDSLLAHPSCDSGRSGIVFLLTHSSVVYKGRQCRGIWKPPKFPCSVENLCPARSHHAGQLPFALRRSWPGHLEPLPAAPAPWHGIIPSWLGTARAWGTSTWCAQAEDSHQLLCQSGVGAQPYCWHQGAEQGGQATVKLAVQVPARERVGRDCVSRREGVAGSFSERLPPCLELPDALAGMRGLMAVVGGDMGEGASGSCLGGSGKTFGLGSVEMRLSFCHLALPR